MPIDKKVFYGGLDTDKDDRIIENGSYRDALNVRIMSSDGSDVGAVENVKGNVLKPLPPGYAFEEGAKCIGSHVSEQRDSVFWFVYSPNGQHGIYERFHESGIIKVVLINSILNFSEDHLINHINDIEGLLYWTDNYNPPRKINIEKATKHMLGDPDGYSSLLENGTDLEREQFINAMKAQPVQRPSFAFFTNASRKVNMIRGKFFRFKYRYVYDDNEKSAWSEISNLTYCNLDFISENNSTEESEFSSFYNFNDVNSALNGIRLFLEPGHETVKRIKIAVSEGNGDFYELDDIPSTSSLDLIPYEFYNDSIAIPIEINDSIKPYDDLPRLANSQELVDGNKLVYGNYLTGYDLSEISYSGSQQVLLTPKFVSASRSVLTESDISQLPFGATYNFNDSGYSSLFLNGGQGTYTFGADEIEYELSWHHREWGISASDFKSKLISLGYDIQESQLVEINFSLGLQDEPYALQSQQLDIFQQYYGEAQVIGFYNGGAFYSTDDSIGEFVAGLTDSGTISVVIPPLDGSEYEDAYHFLYEKLKSSYAWPVSSSIVPLCAPFTIVMGDLVDGLGNESDYFPVGRMKFFEFLNLAIPESSIPYAYSQEYIDGYLFGVDGVDGIWEAWTYDYDNNNLVSPAYTGTIGVKSISIRTTSISIDDATYSSFKSGANHSFGLVYYDDYGRSSLVDHSSNMNVYIPSIPERNLDVGDLNIVSHVEWNISHAPPQWAKYYSWVYSGNGRTDDYIHTMVSEITSSDGSSININLKPLADYQSQNSSTNVSYDFADGDRIMFLTVGSSDGVTNWARDDEGNYVDLPIESAKDTADGYVITVPSWGAENLGDFENSLVEIYSPKPKKSDNKIWHNISKKYPIVEFQIGIGGGGGGIPGGVTGNTVRVHSVGSGRFYRGDSYYYTRLFPSLEEPYVPYVESHSINDNIYSKYYDQGKANIKDNDQGETRYTAQVTYSMPYVSGTKINGLSNFNPVVLPFKEYDRSNGPIQKLFSQDNQLIIFQEDKVNKSMVSRNVIFDNQGGGTLVGTTANVLSDAISYQGDYGISRNPESFAEFGGRIYFTDAKRGSVLRLSRDGLTPISEYGMSTFFMDNLTDPDVINGNVIGGFDPDNGEYIISFRATTIAFHEPSKRWSSRYSFVPDSMVYIFKDLISFKDGNFYLHNANEERNNFYGDDHSSMIEFVSNASPSDKKVFLAIGLESNDAWACPQITTPSGQETNLLATDFDEREGYYYSDILFDVNTPNVENPLIEGDRIRDYAATIKLTNNSTEKVELFAANVNLVKSFRHNG